MDNESLARNPRKFQCKSCEGFFEADEFYASNASRCKECVKAQMRKNRAEKIDYYRLYDRQRYRGDEKRKEAARRSASSEAGKKSKAVCTQRSKENEPEKWKARYAVNNAIRDGKLERGTECYFCSGTERIQAHHHDYSKPMDVFWLCSSCHGKLHTVNGDFLKASE